MTACTIDTLCDKITRKLFTPNGLRALQSMAEFFDGRRAVAECVMYFSYVHEFDRAMEIANQMIENPKVRGRLRQAGIQKMGRV